MQLLKRIYKILVRVVAILLLLLVTLWVLVQLTPVQNWLAKQAAKKLTTALQTEVTVKHVDFSLLNRVLLEGLLVKDRKKDTLAYVGRAGLHITNWFFLKEKAVIRNVVLEQTYVRLYRSDSIWNYQFLVDYFSSPAPGKQKNNGLELELKDVRISRLRLVQQDDWRGETMEGSLRQLTLKPNLINFQTGLVDIDRLELDQPAFSIRSYNGIRPPRKKLPDSYYHQVDTVAHWNLGKWVVKANSVLISDGSFRNDLSTARDPYPYFDGLHIHFKNIDAGFSNLVLKGDTLATQLQLSTIERSGFEVKKLDAAFRWYPGGMELNRLLLETPKSRLTDFFALRFSDFNHDMTNFISHVRMEGRFSNATIHTDDIAFFAPELKGWNDLLTVNGTANGTVEHLKGKSLEVTIGKSTRFRGDFVMDGLPDIDNTFIDVDAQDFVTTYADAIAIFPVIKSIKQPQLQEVSRLQFKGSYTGFLKDFVTYGTIQTNLGTIVADINFKLPPKGEPIYSGKLQTNGFALGTFLGDKRLGKIVMNGSLKGRGLNPRTLFAELDTRLQQLEFNGYNYHNITAKGFLERSRFDGQLGIIDTNLVMNLNGIIDLGKDTPLYKVNGSLFACNFKALGITKQNLFLSGDFDFNFKVKSFDDFTGTALLRNTSLLHNDERLSFDSLYLSNVYVDALRRRLTVQSNEINAQLEGNYSLVQVPDMMLGLLHNYFPAYIPVPRRKVETQNLAFNIETKEISPFIKLLDLPVGGFDYSTIKGAIDVQQNVFNLETYVPAFRLNKVDFENAIVSSKSDFGQLRLNGSIDNIRFNDSLSLPNTVFAAEAANDTGFISIQTSASQTLKDARLNAHFKAASDGFNIKFDPSTLVINEKKWALQDESDFFIGKNRIFSNGIRLTSGNEEIFAYTHPSEIGNYNDIVVELRKVEAGDLLPYFLKDPRLEGSVTGRVDIMNPLGKAVQLDTRLTAERFRFNDDSIGLVTVKANYNTRNGELNYEAESDNLNHHFNIKGSTNLSDLDSIQTNNTLVFENQSLGILEKYLSVILTDIRGTGSGTIQLKGNGNKPDMIGSIRLNRTSFVLDYTKCRYLVDNGTLIQFKPGHIDFGSMPLKDTTGRAATFSGKLFHRFFSEMAFDMSFKANDSKRGLLVLNTTARDNDLFYGTVVANASGSVTGPANDMLIKLFGEPTDSSRLSIPTSDSRVTGTADFIVFRKYGSELQIRSDVKEATSMTVDLDVKANPLAKVFLILDEITNDVIEGQGNGTINLRVGSNEKTTMNGNFTITNGRYTFNWQEVFTKPFLIDKGTISWNGDPYDAQINIDANYLVENVALLPEYANGCNNERNNITVVSNLSNTLKNPEIKFRFELPQGHPCRNNPLTISAFNQLRNNEDELNRQVISLLLIGSFISSNSRSSLGTSTIGSSVISSAAGTLSEFLAQQVTTRLDAAFRNLPGLKNLNLDPYVTFSPGLITSIQADNRGFGGTGKFGFTKRFLNGRILVKAGGSVLVTTPQTGLAQFNNQLTPDVSIEWLITPDGKLRLIGFYRTIFDVQRRNDRAGVSLSYVKEFE